MKHLSASDIDYGTSVLHTLVPSMAADSVGTQLTYLDAILDENTRVNLTSVRQADQAIRLHVADSLIAYPEIVEAPDGPLLDLGSGGGFPGVPLAIATGRQSVLLDSVGRKVAAAQRAVVNAGLAEHVEAVAARAEEYATEHAGAYAVVVARAVAELPVLVELASPLLALNGRFVALKAHLTDEELRRGDAVAAVAGMRRHSVRETTLIGGDEVRSIVVYERCAEPSVRLPRRNGLAQKRPLA